MLEDIAIKVITLPEGELKAISFGLVVFGAILAGLIAPSNKELARAPYFRSDRNSVCGHYGRPVYMARHTGGDGGRLSLGPCFGLVLLNFYSRLFHRKDYNS